MKSKKKIKTIPWDAVEHLKTEEDIAILEIRDTYHIFGSAMSLVKKYGMCP